MFHRMKVYQKFPVAQKNWLCYTGCMNTITQLLPWMQIILSILLVLCVLLQRGGDGIEGALGGSASVSTEFTRRGAEKTLFFITLIIAVLFVTTSIINILVRS